MISRSGEVATGVTVEIEEHSGKMGQFRDPQWFLYLPRFSDVGGCKPTI
jgi:hypothetical protein